MSSNPPAPPLGDANRSALARYFFPAGWTTRLAVMRLICVGTGLLFFRYPMQEHIDMLASPGFERPQWVIQALAGLLGESHFRQPAVLYALFYLTTLAGVAAVIGVFTRTAVGVFGVGMLLEVAHIYSYDELHHVHTMFVLFLIILAFSPCGDCLSFDAWWKRGRRGANRIGETPRAWWEGERSTLAMWPIVTLHILLAVVYFDAASAKLIIGGTHWFNGYTMQHYLLQDGIRHGMPLGVWMSQFREIGILMAVAAVCFEGLFFVVLIPRCRRLVPVILLTGIMMHLGIYFMQKAPFFTWMTLYLTWVPWERFVFRPRAMTSKPTPPPAQPVPAIPAGA